MSDFDPMSMFPKGMTRAEVEQAKADLVAKGLITVDSEAGTVALTEAGAALYRSMTLTEKSS